MPEHIATPAASPRPPLNRVRLLPWLYTQSAWAGYVPQNVR
jgi:hypothetical protein